MPKGKGIGWENFSLLAPGHIYLLVSNFIEIQRDLNILTSVFAKMFRKRRQSKISVLTNLRFGWDVSQNYSVLITEIKIIIKKKLNQLLQPVLSLENCFWGRVNFFIKLGPKIVDSQEKYWIKKIYTCHSNYMRYFYINSQLSLRGT